jgi:hypothetical protein
MNAMNKLTVSTREIGSVRVFDLFGDPSPENLQEVAWKIQRNIRRHRLQRVILNLQMLVSLEPLGLRRLMAACIRPQKSLIYISSRQLALDIESTYVPKNVRICQSEKEVAEDFGPFLLEKNQEQERFPADGQTDKLQSIGYQLERRRSKRMHVALPIELRLVLANGSTLETHAIATNISEGGLFAEYLDLEASRKIEAIDPVQGLKVEIVIYPSANFPEEYHLQGKLCRKEFRKKQLGVGVQFVE